MLTDHCTYEGEFTAKNIKDDLVRLLDSSSMPSSSNVDAALTIRTRS